MTNESYSVSELFADNTTTISGKQLRSKILEKSHNIPHESICLTVNGKLMDDNTFYQDGIIRLSYKLLGGKGGFGSMLRAIGAQIEKTTNREACRDLSGRRLRDINEEKRLKNWLSQSKEREEEKIERKKKKIEKLLEQPKHEFKDESYHAERTNLTDKMHDSLSQGLKRKQEAPSTSGSSKKSTSNKKPKKLMLDEELDAINDTDDDSDDEVDEKTLALAI